MRGEPTAAPTSCALAAVVMAAGLVIEPDGDSELLDFLSNESAQSRRTLSRFTVPASLQWVGSDALLPHTTRVGNLDERRI